VPWKGQVLNQVSAHWFELTNDIVPNHVLAVPDPNVTIARKCKMVPIEAVVRGYLTGVTDTAIWTRYGKGQRDFGGLKLPDAMCKNQKLPAPIFDPTTKEADHDRTLSPDQMIAEGFVSKELFERIKETALALFARGQDIAAQRGLALVDTKYEFGTDGEGRLVLIDEIHTPDSSRYWQLDTYETRIAAGQEPDYFDKEFLRLWFKDRCDPYADKELPAAPRDLVEELSRRYVRMYEQITGKRSSPARCRSCRAWSGTCGLWLFERIAARKNGATAANKNLRFIEAQFAYESAVKFCAVPDDSFSAMVPVLATARNRLTCIADFRARRCDARLSQFLFNGTRFAEASTQQLCARNFAGAGYRFRCSAHRGVKSSTQMPRRSSRNT